MVDVALLGGLRFAAGLPPQTLAELAAMASVQTFAPQSVIFREGDMCPDIFLIESGHVALDMHVPGRGPVRILTVGAGEFLGWSALLNDGPMTCIATALDTIRLVAIPGAKLGALCEANHEIGFRVMQQMARALAQRLVATRLQLLDLFLVGR
ncbi:MAG: Crp/Fnr family transcriptional regulator [Deltaproteobacteria bacterium]